MELGIGAAKTPVLSALAIQAMLLGETVIFIVVGARLRCVVALSIWCQKGGLLRSDFEVTSEGMVLT